jgi:hypothetical protein
MPDSTEHAVEKALDQLRPGLPEFEVRTEIVRPKRFRKLRIAWSVGVVLAFLLYPGTWRSANPPPRSLTDARYWLLAVPTFAFAMAPWIPRRLSLRTLLIATTLLAVVLGFAVWAAS